MWRGEAIEIEPRNDNIKSINKHKLCKIDIGPHLKPHINDAIADSGATIHWLPIIIPSANDMYYHIGLKAIQPDGTRLTSNTNCDLKIKNNLEGAKEAYKFKYMKDNALVSLQVLADNGFKVVLDQNKISINKQGK